MFYQKAKTYREWRSLLGFACFLRYVYRGTQQIAKDDKADCFACPSSMLNQNMQKDSENAGLFLDMRALIDTFIEVRRKLQKMIGRMVFAFLSLMF